MSEFSESYHIRTDDADADAVKKRLRNAKVTGITFGPKNDWLTFVPYEELKDYRDAGGSHGLAVRLSHLLNAPVLWYLHAEDHGWAFALARPRAPVCRFACWWDPAPGVERDQLELAALTSFAPREAIEPLLREFDIGAAFELRPAHRFAELLGLPAYKWLSPRLASNHTNDFLDMGGAKLGTKPPSAAEQFQLPPRRKLELPRPDLSAREALGIVRPFAQNLEGEGWCMASLESYGGVDRDGRAGNFAWRFAYAKLGTFAVIHTALSHSGNLSFSAGIPPAYLLGALSARLALPDDWLDSTQIADIIASEPLAEGLDDKYSLTMRLWPQEGAPFHWKVTRTGVHHPGLTWQDFEVEASTGRINVETYRRVERNQTVEERWRSRTDGAGEWQTPPGAC